MLYVELIAFNTFSLCCVSYYVTYYIIYYISNITQLYCIQVILPVHTLPYRTL